MLEAKPAQVIRAPASGLPSDARASPSYSCSPRAARTRRRSPMPRAARCPACVPNRDGVITADELPIALGATVDYYSSTNTHGRADRRRRGLSASERADDTVDRARARRARRAVVRRDRSRAASSSSTPAAASTASITRMRRRCGSTAPRRRRDGANKTLIVYPTPLPVLRFPVADGEMLHVDGRAHRRRSTACRSTAPTSSTSTSPARAASTCPYVQFSPVLRVRRRAVRTDGRARASRKRTTIFLFECFGEVARAESKQDETNPDFTTAAYLRRFALGVTP